MAKNKAVYSPGELSKVREKLGDIDQNEAKRLANVLGGEVGYEKSENQTNDSSKSRLRQERVDVKIANQPTGRKPGRRVELPLDGDYDETPKPKKERPANPDDDPSRNSKPNYWERLKMDKYAGQPQFEIKSPGQVLMSIFSFFGDAPDYINPRFINKRMQEYYKQLETLVVSTRTLFPRNGARQNERMKKNAPLAFVILDTIRYWNIEKISTELGRFQTKPRNVKVEDFGEILRTIYKPLYILDQLDMEAHVRGAYKVLYKALYIENPMEAQSKYQDLIRSALAAYSEVRKDVRFLLYPLLLKAISAKWLPYDQFFNERKNRLMAFLKVTETDKIDPEQLGALTKPESDNDEIPDDDIKDEPEEEVSPEEQTRRNTVEAEKKALDRGLQTLEVLFPEAGWDRISSYPDMYPYFHDIFDFRKGLVNVAPTDPLQQIYILMRIIEEFFFGLRFVNFGSVVGPDGRPEVVGDFLTETINNWHYYIESSFDKDYLTRLAEYIRLLEGSPEVWNSPYTKKVLSDLHWIKRLYYLPYYRFESITPPPFQKNDIIQIYPEIKKLRRYLAAVAANIEAGNRSGGAENKVRCEGIENPWDSYTFQVPNPVSKRIDALLGPKSKTNASLVFFTLSAVTVLDHLVNNEDSWAYGNRPGPLFRSVNGEGTRPLTGIDTEVDTEAIFKASLKKRQKKDG